MRRILCFVHVPKCAGTSVIQTLKDNLRGRKLIEATYYYNLKQIDAQELA